MFCSKCGFQNQDSAVFCISCGASLKQEMGSNFGGHDMSRTTSAVSAPNAPTSANTSLKGMVTKLIALIAIVVIALIVAVVFAGGVGGVGSSGGRSSSDQVAQGLSESFDQLFESDFTSSAMVETCESIINMMPSEAVDAVMEERGITDRSELTELVHDSFSMDSFSNYTSYLEKMNVHCSFYVDDELTSSELDSINKTFKSSGIDLEATSGNSLGMKVEVTALEDFQGATKGEMKSTDMGSIPMETIMIDGKWYLWGDLG